MSVSISRRGPILLLQFFGLSFALHLVWELLQAPLYDCFADRWHCFLLCLRAAATGDMIFMLVIYGALALVHQNWLWITDRRFYRHPATWILPIFIGILLAVSDELWAVYVAHRWQYTSSMPLLPILQIGLTPVLQMIVVPLLTIWSSQFLLYAKNRVRLHPDGSITGEEVGQ